MRSTLLLIVGMLSFAFLLACSHTPRPATEATGLGFGDFIEQVLKPLAKERAEEVIAQEKGRIEAEHSGISMTAVAAATGAALGASSTVGFGTGIGAAVGGAIGGAIDAKREADRKSALHRLEAQRIPLQQRLVGLFTERTVVNHGIYAFCAMGKYRQYEARGTRFARLMDDPSVECPLQQLLIYANGQTD